MAKKKKIQIASKKFIEDDTVIENGVAVSMSGRDRGSEHILKKGRIEQEHIVVEEIQLAARQNRVRVSKRVDILERLFKANKIDRHTYEAGRHFQSDFYNGQLHGYPGTRFEYVPPATGDKVHGFSMERSRRRIGEIMYVLRKQNRMVADAVWELLGKDRSLSDVAGNDSMKMGALEAYTIMGLDTITNYYQPPSEKNVDDWKR